MPEAARRACYAWRTRAANRSLLISERAPLAHSPIQPHMDRLQAMTMFVTVVETEGFASAARKLNVSPSVVSRMVTELEKRLGVRLLTRTTRIVRLTDAGATYFEDCRRILGEIDAAEVTATGTRTAPRGQLTVTAAVVFGKVHLIPIRARLFDALSGGQRQLLVSRPGCESGRRRCRCRGAYWRAAEFVLAGCRSGESPACLMCGARLP